MARPESFDANTFAWKSRARRRAGPAFASPTARTAAREARKTGSFSSASPFSRKGRASALPMFPRAFAAAARTSSAAFPAAPSRAPRGFTESSSCQEA